MEKIAPRIISKVPSKTEMEFLEEKVYEYNSTKINKDDGRLFSKFIYDSDVIVAGISGWIWAGACEITLFWVEAGFRKKGYGVLLLKAAEEEARKAKCLAILLRTYSFQAPDFYQKYGYTIVHETKDFPPGHSDFCMIKRFQEKIL